MIELGHPIAVGGVKPEGLTGKQVKNGYRLAFSGHRNKAFQMRGDWLPVRSRAGEPFPDDGGSAPIVVDYLKLPESPLKVDGIFGQQTKAAVALFQHDNHITVSGEVDALTLDKLEPLIPSNPLLAVIMREVGSYLTGEITMPTW